MKIYNEVIIDMESGETIYEDSFEYDGPMILCHIGAKGSDKNRDFDADQMELAASSLGDVFGQYKKAGNPFDSFYANEIERMERETSEKRVESEARFSLQKDQAHQSYSLQKSQGVRSYDEQVAQSQQDVRRIQEKTIGAVQDARASQADDSYAAMTSGGAGGLAAAGSRGKKVLAARAKRGVGKISQDLSQQKEEMSEQLRAAEFGRNQNLEEQAMGLSQKTATAEQEMTQTRTGLNRDLGTFTDKMLNEQDNALERLRSEARGIVSSTSAGFKDSYSSWDDNAKPFNPWNTKFDDWDEKNKVT